MKILLISHTCQSRAEGHPKVQQLASLSSVDLCVMVPDRWKHYGTWRAPELPEPDEFKCVVGKVSMPWFGPAQYYLHWYPGLADMIGRFQPDVIDIWEEPWGLVSAHTCWLRNCIAPRTRIVSETEQNINKKLPFPFERFRRYTLRNADFAVARSHEALKVLTEKGYKGPAQVVPNGVNIDMFKPMPRDECRAALGFEGFVVGYVGRLVEEKGLTDLLDALPHCPDDVNLVLVGTGEAKAVLKEQAARLGIANRLHFTDGISPEKLPKFINAFDCLVLPSRTTPRWKEQFGRVLIEAGACEIPVIGTDSGAIRDVIGDAGLIVPEKTPAALAVAINTLRADPSRRRSLGFEGRRRAESLYSWKCVAEQMASVYERVLNMAPSPSREALECDAKALQSA